MNKDSAFKDTEWLDEYKFNTNLGTIGLYWYLGILTTTFNIDAFSHAWFIFILPSWWILRYLREYSKNYYLGSREWI